MTISALISGLALQAAPYMPGHSALQIWDAAGQAAAPTWIRLWVLVMLASFAAGLVFVRRHGPARVAVAGFVLSLLTARFLIPALGIAKLSGLLALIHLVFWSPALAALLHQRAFLGRRSAYAIWSAWMVFVIVFSFIFDIRDAVLYVMHVADIGKIP